MQIIYVDRKKIVNIIFVLLLAIVSLVYKEYISRDALGIFLNNDMDRPIMSVDVPDKRLSLTFDAAWGDEYTGQILDVLKRYNIKATFFITGAWARRYPDVLKRIYDEGHDIGSHSETHVKMSGLQKKEIEMEIKTSSEYIESLTGKKIDLFRAPFGDYNGNVIQTARAMGYWVIQWDVDSLDWKGIGDKDIIDNVVLRADKGSIVLLHNDTENTPKALPNIIENMRKTGYKFVTVSELLMKENCYIDNSGRQKSLE